MPSSSSPSGFVPVNFVNLRNATPPSFNDQLSPECVEKLVQIAMRIKRENVAISAQFQFLYREVLNSQLFTHVIQSYQPSVNDHATIDEAGSLPLVAIRNSSLWLDICTFVLNS